MSKKKSTTQQSTNQTLDPYSRQLYEQSRDQVQNLINTGYQGSWGASELSDAEQRASSLIDDNIGSYEPGLSEARGLITGAEYTPGSIAPRSFEDFDADVYVNPHADGMIDSLTGDIEEAAARTRSGITADTLGSGSYGGSRHGVREAMLDESMLDTIADQSARIRYDTWNQGADRFYQDVGNEISADIYNADQVNRGAYFDLERGGMLADLVGMERGFENEDIQRLMQIGATERGIADQYGQRQYNDYLTQLQTQMALLSSVPMLVDSTGQSTTTQSPGLLDYLNTGANLWETFTTGG